MKRENLGYAEKKEIFAGKVESLKTICPEDTKISLIDLYDIIPGALHPVVLQFVDTLQTLETTTRRRELIALLQLLTTTTVVELNIIVYDLELTDIRSKFSSVVNDFTLKVAEIVGKRKRKKRRN